MLEIMSSSDSEDDCYGNVAKKLQSIKNKYQNNTTENCDTPTDSYQENETFDSDKINKKSSENILEDVNLSINSTDNDEGILDAIIANNTKRTGRSRDKRKLVGSVDSGTTSKRVTRSSRRIGHDSDFIPNDNEVPTNTHGGCRNIHSRSSDQPPKGRNITRRGSNKTTMGSNKTTMGRNKTTRGSNTPRRRRPNESITHRDLFSFLPIYSIGNTDDYHDMCDNQELFTSKNTEVVIDESDPLENEELSVKVYWQNSEVFRFKIRKYQKLTQIFDYFAKRENVSNNKLLFTYNDHILTASDTPDTINYNIAKFIDGGIVNRNITGLLTKTDNIVDGIKIKFQCQNAKKPYETMIRREDKLVLAMMKYAEQIEKPYDSLRFYFDGDSITGNMTALDLELEGGECIDVKLLTL